MIAASPEAGAILLNITQPMLAAELVEVDDIKYVYAALKYGNSRTKIAKVSSKSLSSKKHQNGPAVH